MDKAREGLREAPETLLEAIKHIDIPCESAEHLKNYLTLKGEISRHKSLGQKYEPPKGKKELSDIDLIQKPYNLWPFINEVREGAEQIMSIADRFNMSFTENSNDLYENGKSFFPSLIDRMHLSAVVAKCAVFCAKVEAFVKNHFLFEEHEINPDHCWPSNAKNEVQRHEHNLGIHNKNLNHEKTLNQIRKSQDLSQDDDLSL